MFLRYLLLIKRCIVAALFLCLAVPVSSTESARTPLLVETSAGAVHSFEVELALTPAQRSKGLMYRRDLAPNHGMLFIFRKEGQLSFWMRNTYIPLDIIYVRADGSIVSIVENAEPETDTPRPSKGPAKAVLEIQGGLSKKLGIGPGDIVRHALLGNLPRQAH